MFKGLNLIYIFPFVLQRYKKVFTFAIGKFLFVNREIPILFIQNFARALRGKSLAARVFSGYVLWHSDIIGSNFFSAERITNRDFPFGSYKINYYLCSRFRIVGNAEEQPMNVKPCLKGINFGRYGGILTQRPSFLLPIIIIQYLLMRLARVIITC